MDMLYTIAGFVHFLAAGETARCAGVGRMQVHAPLLDLRDLPSIIGRVILRLGRAPLLWRREVALIFRHLPFLAEEVILGVPFRAKK